MPSPAADLALRLLLGALAVYHLAMGLAAATSPDVAGRLTRVLYGAAVADGAQLRHAVRMVGLLAMTFGGLLVAAALEPAAHHDVVLAVAALQGARAIGRIAWGRDLAVAFGVPRGRNVLNASLLVLEAAALLVLLPPAR